MNPTTRSSRSIYTDGQRVAARYRTLPPLRLWTHGSGNHVRRSSAVSRPFTIKVTQELQAESDIFETFCSENEKDHSHETRH
jgi:hypothetical protein